MRALALGPARIRNFMGSVYIFNFTSEQMSLSINGIPAAGSMQPSVPTSQPPYTPDYMPVGRYDINQNPPSGTFVNSSQNVILAQILIGSSQQSSDPIKFYLGSASEPSTDIWLYMCYSCLLMFSTRGNMQLGGPVPIIWNNSALKEDILTAASFRDSESCG